MSDDILLFTYVSMSVHSVGMCMYAHMHILYAHLCVRPTCVCVCIVCVRVHTHIHALYTHYIHTHRVFSLYNAYRVSNSPIHLCAKLCNTGVCTHYILLLNMTLCLKPYHLQSN